MGERWYDASLGRWTQADPLLQPFSPREANRYASGDLPVETVAHQAGFGSAAALRLHFGRQRGVPPRSYRRAFRTVAS